MGEELKWYYITAFAREVAFSICYAYMLNSKEASVQLIVTRKISILVRIMQHGVNEVPLKLPNETQEQIIISVIRPLYTHTCFQRTSMLNGNRVKSC